MPHSSGILSIVIFINLIMVIRCAGVRCESDLDRRRDSMVYLNISKKLITGESRKKAEESAIANEDPDGLTWEYLEDHTTETVFEDGKLNYSFEIFQESDGVGYVSVDIPIDLDLAAEIVGYYIKKLNRLKTVLEATKE